MMNGLFIAQFSRADFLRPFSVVFRFWLAARRSFVRRKRGIGRAGDTGRTLSRAASATDDQHSRRGSGQSGGISDVKWQMSGFRITCGAVQPPTREACSFMCSTAENTFARGSYSQFMLLGQCSVFRLSFLSKEMTMDGDFSMLATGYPQHVSIPAVYRTSAHGDRRRKSPRADTCRTLVSRFRFSNESGQVSLFDTRRDMPHGERSRPPIVRVFRAAREENALLSCAVFTV